MATTTFDSTESQPITVRDASPICAEIDIEPIRNEPSLRFHAKLGFRRIGTKPYRDGIIVSLQELDLD